MLQTQKTFGGDPRDIGPCRMNPFETTVAALEVHAGSKSSDVMLQRQRAVLKHRDPFRHLLWSTGHRGLPSKVQGSRFQPSTFNPPNRVSENTSLEKRGKYTRGAVKGAGEDFRFLSQKSILFSVQVAAFIASPP